MDDEDLEIPPYAHPQLREQRMDDATRRIILIAAGLGIGVILLAIGWNGLHAGLGPPPVVKPLATPMRTIPANRGGLQVPGANEPILSGAPPAPPHLAPPPPPPDLAPLETAQPKDIQAPTRAGAAPVPLALPLPPARAPNAPATAPQATLSTKIISSNQLSAVSTPNASKPLVAAPTGPSPTPSASTPPASTPPASTRIAAGPKAPMPVPDGPASVQLAALPSHAGAMQAWQTLVARIPTILGGLTPYIVSGQVHGQTYYRVRLNFSSPAEAAKFCAKLHARGIPCYQPHS